MSAMSPHQGWFAVCLIGMRTPRFLIRTNSLNGLDRFPLELDWILCLSNVKVGGQAAFHSAHAERLLCPSACA